MEGACHLSADDLRICWRTGVSDHGPPAPDRDTELSLGEHVGCGLTEAGTLRCWGSGDALLGGVPTGDGWVDFGVWAQLACAVHASGTVECWGDTDDLPASMAGDHERVAASHPSARARGATAGLTCGGREEGADSWGESLPGLNDLHRSSGWLELAPAREAVCGLDSSGHVSCWGRGAEGRGPTDVPASLTAEG